MSAHHGGFSRRQGSGCGQERTARANGGAGPESVELDVEHGCVGEVDDRGGTQKVRAMSKGESPR